MKSIQMHIRNYECLLVKCDRRWKWVKNDTEFGILCEDKTKRGKKSEVLQITLTKLHNHLSIQLFLYIIGFRNS